ncbi:MAG: amidohydrolase [Anaerolineae bacterium]
MAGKISRREFLKEAGLATAALAAGPALTWGPRGQLWRPVASPEQAADMVLLNGDIITVDAADSIARAVAVKDGLIQQVGTNEQIQSLIGPTTKVLDLGGKAVTPGLVDAHNHLRVVGMLGTLYVSLMPPEVRTMDDLRAHLAEKIAQTPEGEWVQGYFLGIQEVGLPTRHDLDPVSPNHPVWLIQQGGHYGSCNSLALQLAGITAATPDPTGGVIGRDQSGEPNGVFYNHRAMDLLRKHIPSPSEEFMRNIITSPQPTFTACGVTTFHDNNVRGVENVRYYFDAGREGSMLLRGSVYYTLEWPQDLDRALYEVERYEDDYIRFAGFKFLLDGQPRMAYTHEPHNGTRWDMPTWDPQVFKDAVRALHDTGYQICVHCAGDAAVDLTLDAFEEAMNANPRPDPRHRIEHCILCRPESIQRIKDLGVVISTQPQFIFFGSEAWSPIWGEERVRNAIPTRSWLEAGIPVALGSDAPTTPWITPQVTLFGAVSRLTYSRQRHSPEQAMTIQEALRAHTMVAAYAGHEEHIKGSIEPGKLADMVVWPQNPYTVDLRQLWETPIQMTIIGGQVVYEA